MTNRDTLSIPLVIEEWLGITRVDEPVTVGIPLPQGVVFDPSWLTLWNVAEQPLPLQTQTLAQWFDGSAKWVLLDFPAHVAANTQAVYQLRAIPPERQTSCQSPHLSVQESNEQIIVDTSSATFFLNRRLGKPFDRVLIQGIDSVEAEGSFFVLTDETGQECVPHIHDLALETVGSLRVTVRARGEFQSASRTGLAHFDMRLSFHAGSGFVAIQLTLHNPRAARHAGGLWDLGDEGSIYFKDLSLRVPVRTQQGLSRAWASQPLQPLKQECSSRIEIYQDSSGGENWRSSNHVNRFGDVKQTFRGYRVTKGDSFIEEGLRATPMLAMHGEHGGVAATIAQFWQNFPKALEAQGDQLIVRLFPHQFGDVFELQGGEQKTHTIYLHFSAPGGLADLSWVQARLTPHANPGWYATAKACSYLSPLCHDHNPECSALIDSVISGSQSFFARREIIDEYGWRHFGDLYADHEAVGRPGETPLVAHYNNQYDMIHGAIVQYLRGGDRRWFELARDLARHVIDIDIYHTQEDRPAYNGGLFWHTDHYLDAATATHRSYSKATLTIRDVASYGGGPSNEHNYTSGLLRYYFLTGDATARDAVLSLADWVINMDDGSHRFLGWLDRRPTGFCSSTTSRAYHGPGRGAGNSLNALLDAYELTREKRYFVKAEGLIRRCIHPRDNIQERHLDDPEHRWSYLVFLQILGKYLDLKINKNEIDGMYSYAQASLLHYASWMREHEAPYATMLDKVEIPTETWPAQDIRKSVVFHLAAKHAEEPLRNACRQKAEYFFQACIRDLRAFPTYTLTRPLVLLLTNAYVHPYFQLHPDETAPPSRQHKYDQPRRFTPQFAELYWMRARIGEWGQVVKEMRRRRHEIVQKGQSLVGANHG